MHQNKHRVTVCAFICYKIYSVLPRPFLQGGTPCLFQEAEMTPCRLLVTPRDVLLYFTWPVLAFVIVIRLIYKKLLATPDLFLYACH